MLTAKCRKILAILLPLFAFASFLPATGSAAEEFSPWGYYKEINMAGDNKYKALYLDEEVYQHSSANLSDIRITDDKGVFVPYYIQNGWTDEKQNEIVYSSKLLSVVKENNDTVIDFKIIPLKENMDTVGNKIVLSLPRQNFFKKINLYGSHDGATWQYVCTDTLYKIDNLEKKEIYLANTEKYRYYRIVILDNAEEVAMERLQLIYSYNQKQWNTYKKVARMDYSITNEGKHTNILLNNVHHLKVKTIVFDIEGNFKRRYEVLGDNKPISPYGRPGEIYNLQFNHYKVSNTSIDFGSYPLSSSQILIKINNDDNRPLKIKDMQVEYYTDKIVFEYIGGAPYRLYFGNPAGLKPSYEIDQYKTHAERENQDLCKLGQMQNNRAVKQESSPFRADYIFNAVIGVVSLLLVVLLARKLNIKN